MLTVGLQGGLGNQLFQLAAAETISSETNRIMCINSNTSPVTVHSTANYFSTIFSKFNNYPVIEQPYVIVNEPSYAKHDWNSLFPKNENIFLNGYFQNWRYISSDFVTKLILPELSEIDGAFIHIRGGDYVNHWLHYVDLTSYYEKALEHFPSETHFYIFTNDNQHAKTFVFLDKIKHTFINEDEIMSLTMMSKCNKGGICANSTFSWWGGYLNPNRTIIIPNKWSHNSNIVSEEGYFFPGFTSLDAI
jgi:hypothetical protein